MKLSDLKVGEWGICEDGQVMLKLTESFQDTASVCILTLVYKEDVGICMRATDLTLSDWFEPSPVTPEGWQELSVSIFPYIPNHKKHLLSSPKEEISNPCSCDLHTVIMRSGCQCGGK